MWPKSEFLLLIGLERIFNSNLVFLLSAWAVHGQQTPKETGHALGVYTKSNPSRGRERTDKEYINLVYIFYNKPPQSGVLQNQKRILSITLLKSKVKFTVLKSKMPAKLLSLGVQISPSHHPGAGPCQHSLAPDCIPSLCITIFSFSALSICWIYHRLPPKRTQVMPLGPIWRIQDHIYKDFIFSPKKRIFTGFRAQCLESDILEDYYSDSFKGGCLSPLQTSSVWSPRDFFFLPAYPISKQCDGPFERSQRLPSSRSDLGHPNAPEQMCMAALPALIMKTNH